MAVNPASIASGTFEAIIAHHTIEATKNMIGDNAPSKDDVMIYLLARIYEALSQQEKKNIDMPMTIQPYPWYYPIDENWLGKPHLCLFIPAATSISIFTEGAGIYTKTIGPGWFQADIRGLLSSGDASNHTVIVSYRDVPIGIAI